MSYILQLSFSVLLLKNSKISQIDLRDVLSYNCQYQCLNTDFTDTGNLGRHHPQALFYFLQFLYSRKQSSPRATQSALQLLKQTIEDDCDKSIHFLGLMSTYQLLVKASELSYDIDEDLMCFSKNIKEIKMSEKYDIFMKFVLKDGEIIKIIEFM